MRPEAGAFFRAALIGLDHAEEHLDGRTPLDVSQILLSLDYMAEMLLKAALLERGESIMERPQRSIGLQAALKRFGSNPHAPLIEVLRERRDTLQHFAVYSDPETVLELADGARRFATELVRTEFGLDLDEPAGKAGPVQLRCLLAARYLKLWARYSEMRRLADAFSPGLRGGPDRAASAFEFGNRTGKRGGLLQTKTSSTCPTPTALTWWLIDNRAELSGMTFAQGKEHCSPRQEDQVQSLTASSLPRASASPAD